MSSRVLPPTLLLMSLLVAAAWGVEPRQPARLTLLGLEKVPDGPRQAFEAYWRAFAEAKIDDAVACLHGDFLGDEGGKLDRRMRLDRAWRGSRIKAIAIEVEHAQPAKTHTRPRSFRAPEKTWTGDLCVIRSRATTTIENLGTKARDSRKSLPTQTVLRKDADGKWRILGEHVESRNLKAALLGTDLNAALKASLEKTRLWDGAQELSALDALRAQLPKGHGPALFSWEPVGVLMAGELRDEPQIKGRLTAEPIAGKAGEPPAVFEITISMVMDKGRLRLAGIQAKPTAYVPTEKEPPDEKEPEPEKED